MPPRSDLPLKKVTLYLYAKDVKKAEDIIGRGWSETLRDVWSDHLLKIQVRERITLGDLDGD